MAVFSQAKAKVTAVGRPLATSLAKLGPERAPAATSPPDSSTRMEVMVEKVSSSMPLEALMWMAPGLALGRMSLAASRKAWLGTTQRTASASPTTSAGSLETTMEAGSLWPGKNSTFSRSERTRSARAGRRAQRLTESPWREAWRAKVVPQAPAPITATRLGAGPAFMALLSAMFRLLWATGLGAAGPWATGQETAGLWATGLGAAGLWTTGQGAVGLWATGQGTAGLWATGLGPDRPKGQSEN